MLLGSAHVKLAVCIRPKKTNARKRRLSHKAFSQSRNPTPRDYGLRFLKGGRVLQNPSLSNAKSQSEL
jgi:hypothetical protein